MRENSSVGLDQSPLVSSVQRKKDIENEKRCSGAKWISRTRPTINNAFLGSAGHISRCCGSLLSHLPRKSQLAPLLLFLII